MAFVILLVAVPLVLVTTFWYSFLIPPKHFPKTIPTIPFYVSLLSLVKDLDQQDLYRKYLQKPLEKHGAVKIFFGARWNILVQRPEFVAEVFKHETIYAKSGNQRKIPYSVLADYTGDNIISSHGDNWKLYQSVFKPGLQRDFDIDPILRNARVLIDLLCQEQAASSSKSVIVGQLLQRYALANLSESILQVDFETLKNSEAPLHTLQLAIKREVFKPIFLNFPFLDLLPFESRKNARKLVHRFTDVLSETIRNGHKHTQCDMATDKLGSRLIAARDMDLLSEQQLRHNMVSVFLAGHENPQLALVSMMYLLGKHQDIQHRLRQEILAVGEETLSHASLKAMPYFTSVIYETLRLFPPISQLINRKTSETVLLGNEVLIPEGTYLGYNAYATNRDRKTWGDTSDNFLPERWGSTAEEINNRYRRANSQAEFISFHGGRRACLGQKFAMLEVRVTMYEVMRKLKWSLDPEWPEKMTPVSTGFAEVKYD
ncbi:MAG: cytochrome P450-dit2 [Candelina submexicana]|nr:MAG: cytochrome P450-dit2 [Candelina submexicana]